MCFSAAASSENDQGSMNFASNKTGETLSVPPARLETKKAQKEVDTALNNAGMTIVGDWI